MHTAAEQFMIELINRARLDPAAEAARQGTDLNAGLNPGTISTAAKQVLAPNAALLAASAAHSQWMLDTNTFSHTGEGGSSPGQRATAAGYAWRSIGENLSWTGTTGTLNPDSRIQQQHNSLYNSAGHRRNMFNESWQEVGIAQGIGQFTHSSGTTFNASMITQKFARPSAAAKFLTGVAFDDADGNLFYGIGEGVAGVTFAAGGVAAATAASGGYALSLPAASATVQVTVTRGAVTGTVEVDLSAGNVKLDLVGSGTLLASSDLTLISGAFDAHLLGIADLTLTGSARGEALHGNRGANVIFGEGGDDTIAGGAGNDSLYGGDGDDWLFGEDGDDHLVGNDGDDRVDGGAGNDRLFGGRGNDSLWGGDGQDTLFGGSGNDHLVGNDGDDLVFGEGGHDRLYGGRGDDALFGGPGDDTLWGGSGDDTLEGGTGSDILWGGAGADTFVWSDAAQSPMSPSRDRIMDFEPGLDRIDLSGIFAGLTFVDRYTGTAGEVRYDAAIGRLYADLTGNRASDFSLDLAGRPAITEADLVL